MRRNNDIMRGARAKQAVNDLIADLGSAVSIYRGGVLVGSAVGVVDAEAHSRVSSASLATFRFLYRVYLRLPVDVAQSDTLLCNGSWFLVRDVDSGISFRLAAACLCERVSGP